MVAREDYDFMVRDCRNLEIRAGRDLLADTRSEGRQQWTENEGCQKTRDAAAAADGVSVCATGFRN